MESALVLSCKFILNLFELDCRGKGNRNVFAASNRESTSFNRNWSKRREVFVALSTRGLAHINSLRERKGQWVSSRNIMKFLF